MNKEEFVSQRNALREQLNELEKEYIRTNVPYPVGTKIVVTGNNGKSRIGIVKDSIISGDNVVPLVMQLTNEGKESLRRIVVYPGDDIKIVKE